MDDENDQVKEVTQEISEGKYLHKENKLKKLFITYGLLIFTIVLFIIFSILNPVFLSQRNIFNLLSQGSAIGILALGFTTIVISGNFDISFAANAALVSIICPILIEDLGVPLLIAYLISMVLAIIISIINGIIIVFLNVPSLIATFGMSNFLFGISNWITKGNYLCFPYILPAYKIIGKGKIGGVVPVALLIFLIIAFFVIVFLEISYKGRQFYVVGSNLQAAARVGINVKKIKFQAFFIMGITAGMGGLIIGSIFETADPAVGTALLFPAVIVALLGAVFLKEGIPNVLGTMVAAILMSGISNGFVLLGYTLWVKEITEGVILIFSVSVISILKPGGLPSVEM